jgi:hypothetical protein
MKDDVQKKFENLAKERYENDKKKMADKEWTFWTELAIFVVALGLVPVLIVVVLIIFPATKDL